MKRVSDEELVSALLSHGRIAAAAAACGLSQRQFRDRIHTQTFQELYMAAREDILRSTVHALNSKLGQAFDTIADIMTNTSAKKNIRLQAALSLIDLADKFTERLDKLEKSELDKATSPDISFLLLPRGGEDTSEGEEND